VRLPRDALPFIGNKSMHLDQEHNLTTEETFHSLNHSIHGFKTAHRGEKAYPKFR